MGGLGVAIYIFVMLVEIGFGLDWIGLGWDPVVAESAIDEVAALSTLENIQYFYIVLKKVFLKY